jgi:hypothetical protein
MGFSYKTSWIAVPSRTTIEVADALTLGRRRPMSYSDGTNAAYTSGVFVAPPIGDWTLAHGRELGDDIPPTGPDFLDWLTTMSRRLGEVQYFGTHRVSDWHQWAWARDGAVVRAYAVVGLEILQFVGEPTPAEVDCGVGTLPEVPDPGVDAENWEWDDPRWEQWSSTTPDESDVMRIAGLWSVDPTEIDDDTITGSGLYGSLTWQQPTAPARPPLRSSIPPADLR